MKKLKRKGWVVEDNFNQYAITIDTAVPGTFKRVSRWLNTLSTNHIFELYFIDTAGVEHNIGKYSDNDLYALCIGCDKLQKCYYD